MVVEEEGKERERVGRGGREGVHLRAPRSWRVLARVLACARVSAHLKVVVLPLAVAHLRAQHKKRTHAISAHNTRTL